MGHGGKTLYRSENALRYGLQQYGGRMEIRIGPPEDFAEARDRLLAAALGYCASSQDEFIQHNKHTFVTDLCVSIFKHAKSIGYYKDTLVIPLQLFRKLFANGEFTPKICDEINSAFPQFLQTAARGLHGGYRDIANGGVTLDMFLKITPIAFDVDSTSGKY